MDATFLQGIILVLTAISVLKEQMDSNRDGLVDFEEFVAAALHVHQLEELDVVKWNQRTLTAFQMFDMDKDGFITPEELKVVCHNLILLLLLPNVAIHACVQ